MYGYAGKMLFVNLTDQTYEEKPLPEELAKNFLSGYGIGAKVLFDMMKPGVDPLGPDNVLGFVTGVTNATNATMGGRYVVVCKSPVTGGWNDSNSGGFFGPELKKAGYDAVFFTGKSEKPVYVWIDDGKIEFRDATHLMGMQIKPTEEAIKAEVGESRLRAAIIGPAGENLSHMAAIINDGHRAAGRGGCGAVMGSKNLKAFAVHGTGKIEVADRARLLEANKKIIQNIKNPDPNSPITEIMCIFRDFGSAGTATPGTLSGDSPVKNWSSAGFEYYSEEDAYELGLYPSNEKFKTQGYACSSCAFGCGARYNVNEGRWPIGETERPEYETIAAFGTDCLVKDVDAILKCNDLCNSYGIDTISAGCTIAWAMDCYDRGLITIDQLDGIDAKWGDSVAMVTLMEKMANFEGCGKILVMGQKYASEYYGVGHDLMSTSGGVELGMHDPRMPAQRGRARGYRFDPTPGRHVKNGAHPIPIEAPDWSELDIIFTANCEVMNAAGFCMFTEFAFLPDSMAELITAVTGQPYDDNHTLQDTGRRVFLMRHAFNIREGIYRKDTEMISRLLGKPPITSGPNKDVVIDVEALGDGFYKNMGCDIETGFPLKETLEKAGGMESVIAELYK